MRNSNGLPLGGRARQRLARRGNGCARGRNRLASGGARQKLIRGNRPARNYLGGLGLRMIREGWSDDVEEEAEKPGRHSFWLLAVTGFLGGLTTFSSFSGESLLLLQRGQWGWAIAHTVAHVVGALAFAAIGFRLGRALWG